MNSANHKARLRRALDDFAKRFEGDGTDRAMRITGAINEIESRGGLDDFDLAIAIKSLVWHVADGLDPDRHASERARNASAHAAFGAQELRRKARELASDRSDKTRAETVRAIWPALISYRDVLRGMGYNVPNMNGERAPRTVSDWLKD